MSYDYTDAWGNVVDTGQAAADTARTNTELEFHVPGRETDTGSTLTLNASTLSSTGIPHFPAHRPASAIR